MRVLVIGSGAREHALAWKLSSEAEVFAAPGNPGIARVAQTFDVPIQDHHAVADLARRLSPDFVLIGPEDPLIHGLSDTLRAGGINVVGPGGHAALLEGSKAFAKALMREAAIPTAEYQVFTDHQDAVEYASSRFDQGLAVAVKASGAALGKGVVVCASLGEAQSAIRMMLVDHVLGEAGRTVVVEDRLSGREFSLLTLCSSGDFVSLPVAQDFKRAYDGDQGPNTGGMGSCCPAPWVSSALVEETEVRVVAPMLDLLRSKGIDYRGILFSGLMLSEDTPYCLEFNVRFGDPETQSVMMVLGDGLAESLHAVALGAAIPPPHVMDRAAVSVVLASEGYPGPYRRGHPISIEQVPEHVQIFHGGTATHEGQLVTAGGRVLTITASDPTVSGARARCYRAIDFVGFQGMRYRLDIGDYAEAG